MAITERESLSYWNYFLALEADLERLSRFVEFTSVNFQTYSLEMARLLLTGASEVDVVAKHYCSLLSAERAENINHYRQIIGPQIRGRETTTVFMPRYGLELTPWGSWKDDTAPDWWTDHNKVKHQRRLYYDRANLKNVLNALGGLFLLLVWFYRNQPEIRRLVPAPSLFSAPPEVIKRAHFHDGETGLYYDELILSMAGLLA